MFLFNYKYWNYYSFNTKIVKKNKIFTCIDHLKQDSINQKSATLIFVSFLKKKNIQDRFKINFKNELNHALNPKLFVHTFAELKNNVLNYFD